MVWALELPKPGGRAVQLQHSLEVSRRHIRRAEDKLLGPAYARQNEPSIRLKN